MDEIKKIEFTPAEKEAAFDRIAERYFHHNFGSLPKANLDVLLFSIYYDHCQAAHLSTRDYDLSKQLGISQARIRTLKMNRMLQDTTERKENWKREFFACIASARYDKHTGMVKMLVPEVTVLSELRHFIELNHMYDEYQLNPRLFQCNVTDFVKLAALLEGETLSERPDDAALKKLMEFEKETESETEKSALESIMEGDWKAGLKKLAASAGKNLVAGVIELIPGGKVLKDVLGILAKVIREA